MTAATPIAIVAELSIESLLWRRANRLVLVAIELDRIGEPNAAQVVRWSSEVMRKQCPDRMGALVRLALAQVRAYRTFLEAFPKGPEADDARAAVDALSATTLYLRAARAAVWRATRAAKL
ncbi:MAG: hypothetical protein HOW73_43255 [Polyangiaceae bacterium]|nr:hypothetical protein [Polyangiaceae bacterium]